MPRSIFASIDFNTQQVQCDSLEDLIHEMRDER